MNRLLSRLRSGRIPWTSRPMLVLTRRVCNVSTRSPYTLPAQKRITKTTVCSMRSNSSGGRYAKSEGNRACLLYTSTGIGLYLVARLCSKMGIDVTASSEPREGFVVTFAFSTNKFQYFE